MDLGVPPLEIKSIPESNPAKSRALARELTIPPLLWFRATQVRALDDRA